MHAHELKMIMVRMVHGSKVSGNIFKFVADSSNYFRATPNVFTPLSSKYILGLYKNKMFRSFMTKENIHKKGRRWAIPRYRL